MDPDENQPPQPPFDRYDHRSDRRSPFGEAGFGGSEKAIRGRSRTVAIVLALFVGGLGIHKFYLGRVWQGLLYLVFFWTAIPAIASWIEAVLLLNTEDAAFARRYGGSGAPANRTAIGCLWVLAVAPIVMTLLYLLMGGEPGGLMPNPFPAA